jgi:hypothetical protein
MADPRSPSDPAGRAGWRSKAKAASAAPRAAKAGGWAKKMDDGVERTVMRYRTKVVLWSSLFLSLVAGFVVWLIWTPVLTPVVVATGVNYEFPLPPNAFAEEDSQRLFELHGKEVLKYVNVDLGASGSWLTQLAEKVKKAKPGGPHKNVVVVCLSMHGAVNGKNEPCLIPPGVPPLDESNWLRVADLLDTLFPGDNPALRSAKVNKLLILDANRMDLKWGLGLLYNTFADRLAAVVREKNIPGLAVLNSASPGQIGWAAPELRDSAFGFFLWRGLGGAARSGKNGKVITLQDLAAYVQNNVSRWVAEKRADDQMPMLIPAGANFPLVYARTSEKMTTPSAESLHDSRWGDVHALWLRHAALKEKRVGLANPQQWQEFESGLMRLEMLVQAGTAYETQFGAQLTAVKNDLAALERSDAGRELAAFNLPLKRALGQAPGEEEWKGSAPPWQEPAKPEVKEKEKEKPAATKVENKESDAKVTEKPAENPQSADKEKAADKPLKIEAKSAAAEKGAKSGEKETQEQKSSPPTAAPPPAPVRYSYVGAASVAWDWMAGNGFSASELQNALKYIDGGINRPKTAEAELVEVQFMRMLAAHLDSNVWTASPQSINHAILARKAAETAAAPNDARAFYWIFPQVEAGDRVRREAEDKLFIGSESALREAEQKWDEAVRSSDGKYAQAKTAAETIASAYRWRDQAYADAPGLARWVFSRTHRRPDADAQLTDAIKAVRRLAALLDGWKAGSAAGALSEIAAAKATLQKDIEELEATYFRDCTNTAGDDKEKLARLLNVLAVPIVTGKERNDDWENCLKIMAATAAFKELAGDTATPSATTPSDTYPDRLQLDGANRASGRLHSLLYALESAAGEDDSKLEAAAAPRVEKRPAGVELAEQGERVRELLLGARKAAEERLAKTIRQAQLDQPSLAELDAIRAPLSGADRMIRAFAPLVGSGLRWDDPRHDPLARLRSLDRHNLLVWQAWRTLEDFWGPPNPSDPSYFETSAKGYLKSAADLFREDAAIRDGAVAKRLKSGGEAAALGLQLTKPRSPSLDSESPSVEQQISLSAAGFPAGHAAVYLQGGDDSLFPVADKANAAQPNLRRIANPLPNSNKPQSLAFWILNDSRLNESPQLHAIAYYRGFVRTQDFYVNTAKGRDILWAAKAPTKPTITVHGDLLKKSNLMFVFDCSGSMSKMVRGGASQEGPSEAKSRFETVKDALEKILDRLAKPPYPYNVGLMIYAHRVGWIDEPRGSRTNFHIVIRDPNDSSKFVVPPPGFNIRPSFDVELALPLGRFTQYECGVAKERLDALRPLGETPLYLSIIQALKHFEAAEPDSVRHIIVLTDGGNQQSDRSNQQIMADPQSAKLIKTIGDVEEAFNVPAHKGVKLDVLGFDLTDVNFESAEEKASAEELMNFATRQRGYHPVSNRDTLTRELEKSMGLVKYEVERIRDQKIITPDPLDLNTTCETVDRPGGYRIALVDQGRVPAPDAPKADVVLEGGEAEDLTVVEDQVHGRRRLAHHRYKDELRDMADKISVPGDPKRACFLGAHLPDPFAGGVKFFVSVQNADAEQFSPRPVEVWAEIKPVMPEGADVPAYICCDRTFVPNRPVPVLEFDVPNWPSEAENAEIRLWCKFERTPPDKQPTVGESHGKAIPLDGVPDISFEIETRRGAKAADSCQVIVTETHSQGGDLGLVKVEMDHPPKSIKRHYNDRTGMVVHTFFYDESAVPELDRYQVLLTSAKKLKDGAVATPSDRALKVKVPLSPKTGQ